MTASIVIFTEEPSARIVIDEVCRRCFPSTAFQVLEHEGKRDLEKSIARKINAWKSPVKPRFIIARDLDSADRVELRERLLNLVPHHSRSRVKVRIIVPELEAWYFGDPKALLLAGLVNNVTSARLAASARYRNLCVLRNAKTEFKKLVGNVGQIDAANRIGPVLDPTRNTSVNFIAFLEAVRWAVNTLPV